MKVKGVIIEAALEAAIGVLMAGSCYCCYKLGYLKCSEEHLERLQNLINKNQPEFIDAEAE